MQWTMSSCFLTQKQLKRKKKHTVQDKNELRVKYLLNKTKGDTNANSVYVLFVLSRVESEIRKRLQRPYFLRSWIIYKISKVQFLLNWSRRRTRPVFLWSQRRPKPWWVKCVPSFLYARARGFVGGCNFSISIFILYNENQRMSEGSHSFVSAKLPKWCVYDSPDSAILSWYFWFPL